MSIAFRGTADLPQQALLDSFEAPDQTAADAADPGAAATSADDDAAQRAQQGAAAAQPVIPWQQRMPPLAIDSPAFTIKQSAPAVQREARDGGGNGAGDGDVGGGGTGGRSGGDTSRSPGGRDAPAASVQPSAGNGSLVRVPVLPQTSARANIGTPDPVHDRGSWIGSPASDQDRTYRILPVGRPQGEMLVDGGAPPADARVSDQEPVYRILPVGGAQGEVLFDDTAPPASAPASDQEPVYRILPVGGAHGVWIDEAQSIFGERTPANHGTVKTTRDGASTTAAPPPATASTAAVLEAAMQAARQAAPPGAATAAAAGAAPAAAAAPAPAPTATTGTAQPAQPQPQQQQQQPTPAAAPGIDDAWAQDRRSAMGAVQQAYQAARAQAEAAGQFLTTVTESDESSSREVVVFDEAAFTQAWLTGGSGGAANAGLQTLARLYGMADAQALIAQRRDVVDLALARGTSVGLYEGAPPAGHAMSSAQELQALDGILYSDMNRVLVAQFGSGPVEPPRTALAQEQLRRYGQERYEQMARIERAQAHIQGDFARALEQARNDPNSVGWHEVQEQVQVREGPVDESGQATGPTVTRTITRREFSVDRFSEWYTRAPSQEELAALQANPTAAGSAELLSRIAFAQLYGAAHEVVVYLGSDESGCAIEQREVRFTVQMGGQQHELTLQGERLVQSGFVAVNLNDPPRLNDQAGVFWNPLLGWSTHESNIHHSRDWFETIVTVVIIAAVSYVSAGTLGPAVAGALGATAGTIGAAVVTGAVVGATTAVVSGAISGNFSWRNVLQGMVLGGVGGAMTFGVNALAQGAADGALQAAAAGDPTAWDAARSTMNTVRSVGTVVQGGITSELGGGDFGEGVLGAMGNVAAGSVGNQVTQGLVDSVGEPMARVIGGVASAGVSSVIVNARGGDGDNAFVSGVVNTGVGLLPPELSASSAADYRNGSDVESDAADAARREQQWVQQSDEITARRGAETAPGEVPAEVPGEVPAAVPGRTPDIGDDLSPPMAGGAHPVEQGETTSDATSTPSGMADSVPVPTPQATDGVGASPSADEPPQASTPLDFELPWVPLAPIDSNANTLFDSFDDSTRDRAGETESERAAAADRAAALQALRQSEIAQQNDAAGARGDLTPDSAAHEVRRGDTVERIAREHYGRNWRAGQAAIMGANGLRTNAESSPLIREGQSLVLPDLAPVSEDQLPGLSREGGRITANNQAGLENARIEREAAVSQSELTRFANRSTSAATSEAAAPEGMSPDEAYRVYMSYGGRSGADPVATGANVTADPAAIDYSDAATSMNGSGTPLVGQRLSEALPNMGPGIFRQRYDEAVAGFANSNNSWDERLVYFGLGAAMGPMMLLEEGGRGLINAPRQLASGGENAAAVFTAPTTEDRIVAGLTAVRDTSFGIVGLAPLVPANRMMGPLVQTPEELAVRAFSGAEASFAARATYADNAALQQEIRVSQQQQVASVAEARGTAGTTSLPSLDSLGGVSPAAPGPVSFMGRADEFLLNASRRTDIDSNGLFDVVAHGSSNRIQIQTADGAVLVDHRVAARLIEQSSGYSGQNIRLLSCSTGACETGFAQNLANRLGVEVHAPTDLLWAYPDGSMVVAPRGVSGPLLTSPGEFRVFTPRRP